LSGLLQAYSALPFNITSGVTTVQGTAGRRFDSQFSSSGTPASARLFSLGARLIRSFPVARPVSKARRGLQRDQSAQRPDPQHKLRSGRYPTNPSPTFNQITAVGDPRTFQFALRIKF